MESRRSESAPASVATEIMQPAVIRVRSELAGRPESIGHDGAAGEDDKADEGHDQHEGMVAAEGDHFCQPGGLV